MQSKNQLESITKLFGANLAKDLEGRATPQDIDSIEENLPKFTDNAATLNTKFVNLTNMIKTKYSFPTLTSQRLLNENDPLIKPVIGIPGAETVRSGQ